MIYRSEKRRKNKDGVVEEDPKLIQCSCGITMTPDGKRVGTGKDREKFLKIIKGVLRRWAGK